MVEFAIVAPLFLLLIVGGIEFVRALRIQTSLAYASRQITIAALRECLAPSAPANCVTTQTTRVYQAGSAMVSGLRLMMSIWDYNTSTLLCEQRSWSEAGVTFAPPYDHYNYPSLDLSQTIISDLCRDEQVLAVGEAFVEYEPLVPEVARLFGLERRVFRVALLA